MSFCTIHGQVVTFQQCARPGRNDPPSAHGPTVYTADLVRTGGMHTALSSPSALYTADLVPAGVCTLVAAGTAHSPVGMTLPVRTARSSPLRQCANLLRNGPASAHGPTVYTADLVRTGVCTLRFRRRRPGRTGAMPACVVPRPHARAGCVQNGNPCRRRPPSWFRSRRHCYPVPSGTEKCEVPPAASHETRHTKCRRT